jgi:hypothetical protein
MRGVEAGKGADLALRHGLRNRATNRPRATMAQEMNQGQEWKGNLVAVVMIDGVEQIEYPSPRSFLEQHGVWPWRNI